MNRSVAIVPLRGILEMAKGGRNNTVNRRRACYVNVHQAPRAVFQAFHNGRYEPFDRQRHLDLFRGRMLRSAHMAIPAPFLMPSGQRWPTWLMRRTGYTHQWQQGRFWRYRRLVMASCESLADASDAQSRGLENFPHCDHG